MTPPPILLPSSPEVLARYPAVAAAARRRQMWAITWLTAALAFTTFSLWWLDIVFGEIGTGLVQLGKFVALMFPPMPGTHPAVLLHAMGETLAIAFLGTLAAALLAFPIGFIAASNTTPGALVRFLTRRGLDTIRGIDVLIWALVFVGVVGLGPFAGILAIAVSDAGTFGKLFSETLETADRKPVESVVSAGGTKLQTIRFALLPQVLPVIISQVLYYFESNVRSATIIGIVGAGGIGLQLSEEIRTYDFDQVAFVTIMILVTVAAIDWVCGKLRFYVIGRSSAPAA
jgi:phosphonate transport system permease protein